MRPNPWGDKTPTPEEFLKYWLRGTTCCKDDRKKIVFTSEDSRFVFLRHAGHSERTGRWDTTAWCPTYYSFFDLHNLAPHKWGSGHQPIHTFEGRLPKNYLNVLEEVMEKHRKETT